jgi:hypothetical protein
MPRNGSEHQGAKLKVPSDVLGAEVSQPLDKVRNIDCDNCNEHKRDGDGEVFHDAQQLFTNRIVRVIANNTDTIESPLSF